MTTNNTILVTGTAGFIGFHVTRSLLARGYRVVGIDNLNDYYDPQLKIDRLKELGITNQEQLIGDIAPTDLAKDFVFCKMDLCDKESLQKLAETFAIDKICHLAAQAGVRYSLINPEVYQKSNLEGFLNIIELARHNGVKNFVYASSSSVYGGNEKIPFAESDAVDRPISLYAATKKANELMAYAYSHLYQLPCTGLRFFTVYGPWGRPDMAYYKFAKMISEGEPIEVYNQGEMIRNFTYIDDAVQGVISCLEHPTSYAIYNIGNDRAENLLDFIATIEKCLGKRAKLVMKELQAGDMEKTVADITLMRERFGYEPKTNIIEGVRAFVGWFEWYHGTVGK